MQPIRLGQNSGFRQPPSAARLALWALAALLGCGQAAQPAAGAGGDAGSDAPQAAEVEQDAGVETSADLGSDLGAVDAADAADSPDVPDAPDAPDAPQTPDTQDGFDAAVPADTGPDSADAPVPVDAEADAGDAAPDLSDAGPDAAAADSGDAQGDAQGDAGADAAPKDIQFGWDTGKDTAQLPACSPPLKLLPADPKVLTLQLLDLQPSGGTGQYRFELTKNASDGLVNLYTGAYLSGDKAGTTDVVQLTDMGCVGQAQLSIQVLEPMEVVPAQAELPPAGKLAVQASLGSGVYVYSLKVNQSGGSVTPAGLYTAGAKAGSDVIAVTDSGTGQVAQVAVAVVAGSKLTPVPLRLALPVGATAKVAVRGGSGVLQTTAKGPQVTAKGDLITGVAPGQVSVAIADKLTGQSAAVTVEVVAAKLPAMPRSGDFFEVAAAVAADLDGDGWSEALLGLPESDQTRYNDGALYLYRGAAVGLSSEPSQVLHGALSEDRFGYAVAAGDVEGTPLPEVVVGAPLADAGAADAGQVSIFGWNSAQAKLGEAPLRQLFGPFAGDQFGTAVAVCDFNADGWLDLAVGAPAGENRDLSPIVGDQGAVHIFLGHEEGFLDAAEQRVYGALPGADGAWKATANLRLGQTLAAGDIDGDGACDLAVTALNHTMPGGAAGDGAVFVYRGVAASKATIGGVTSLPVRALQPDAASGIQSALGRWLAVGDLDGDGKAELAATQRNHDAAIGATTALNAGAVRVWKGGPLSSAAPPALAAASSAAWSVEGPKTSDAFGASVHIGDATGDGLPDLLVGHALFELTAAPGAPAAPTDSGVLALYPGKKGALPATTPAQQWAGEANGARFGLAAAVLPKSAAGAKPALLVFASNSSDLGPQVGRPYWLVPGKPMVKLGMPGLPAGQRLGTAVALPGDFDGDGAADLLAAAYAFDDPKGGEPNTGDLWLWKGGPGGVASVPAFDWLDFVGHSSSDQFGYAMAPAGNFDGDGKADLAVVARSEDVVVPFSKSYALVAPAVACLGDPAKPATFKAANDTGAVYVFSAGAAGSPLGNAPRWVIYGPQAGQVLDSVAGGFDYDGDGLDDLAIGSLGYDAPGRLNAGAVMLVRGRKVSSTPGIQVQCPDLLVPGLAANDGLGRSVAGLADLDGDGCDEVAVGAAGVDQPGKNDQGAVFVLFGYGAACKRKSPEWMALYSGEAAAQAGFALASGDLDGDAAGDLVVGAVGHLKAGNQVGAAWVVRGSYLAKLGSEPWVDGAVPDAKLPLLDPAGLGLAVEGSAVGERAGSAVAVVPRPNAMAFSGVVVGSPLGAAGGVPLSGHIRVHRFDAGSAAKPGPGLLPDPALIVVGETLPGLGRMGEALAVGLSGGKPALVAAAPTGTPAGAVGVDLGSVYLVSLDGLN